MPIARFLPIPMLCALAGCAGSGAYPSLAPRALERNLTGGSAPAGCPVPADTAAAVSGSAAAATPAVASDPALRARIADLLAAARAGQTEFAALLPQAEQSAARAGSAQSETWIEAQQDLSRLQAARGPTVDALSDLDALGIRPAAGPAVNAEDYAAILAAAEEVRALAEAQDAAIDRISGRLAAPGAD